MKPLLQVENVEKTYGNHKVLSDVSLTVEPGTIYGLLGPNGAGKTTLIRIINHITAPDAGRVLFDGEPLTQNHTSLIGYLPEERGLYKKMKVGEQALFFARLKGLDTATATSRLRSWFEHFDILSWWDKPVEELSKGMAQKVQFIVTVLHEPKLLIFDEPFSGFDPINANLLRDEILRLRDNGTTVIFSTHNMASVEEICSDFSLINHGQNILTGKVDEVRRQFSEGRYVMQFEGDVRTYLQALLPMLETNEVNTSAAGVTTAHIKLQPEVDVRRVIAAANEAVRLRSFSEDIASMNDIFIQTVKSAE